MISPAAAMPRSPGTGRMSCCDRNHVKIDAAGVPQPIPCRKDKMAPIILKLLRSLQEYHFGRDELLSFRMFTALTPLLMSGLSSEGMPPPPRSVNAFLTQNRFSKPDDETGASGFTPLVFAAMSGNIDVVRELITTHHVEVNARVRVGMPKFGIEKGMHALALAAAVCPQNKVHEMVSFLLASGSDPNLTFPGSGGTPLMAAVAWHNLECVRTLVSCNRLDLEKGLNANNATALLIAANAGTFEILDALLQAGANREHR